MWQLLCVFGSSIVQVMCASSKLCFVLYYPFGDSVNFPLLCYALALVNLLQLVICDVQHLACRVNGIVHWSEGVFSTPYSLVWHAHCHRCVLHTNTGVHCTPKYKVCLARCAKCHCCSTPYLVCNAHLFYGVNAILCCISDA